MYRTSSWASDAAKTDISLRLTADVALLLPSLTWFGSCCLLALAAVGLSMELVVICLCGAYDFVRIVYPYFLIVARTSVASVEKG